MKRRTFALSGMSVLTAGMTGCGSPSERGQEKTSAAPEQTGPKPYGMQYYDTAAAVWERAATTELPIIAEAADHAAASLKNGGSLYSHAMFGHMLTSELRVGRPGNPDYLPTWGWSAKDEDFAAIGKGDFLFFDYTKTPIKEAHDRGAFTLGARVPYLPNRTTPRGVLTTLEATGGLLTEDCADLVLTSGLPFTNGVLYVPEIPAVRACPMSVQGVGNFYWMLSAEIAMRDKGGAADGSSDRALEYIELIRSRAALIRKDFDHIDEVARAMTGWVADGGRYWNYSHGCEMSAENTHRASGLPMSQTLREKDVAPGHFCIIAGEASDVPENVAMARKLKEQGLHIISIGPASTEGGSGDDVSALADHHIETYSPEREGALDIPGFDRKLCPTTGILYALALWMLNSQFIGHMVEADMTPGLDMGGHLIGGNEYNKAMRPIVAERGW